jgi:glutamate-1-semialdehyde 2,1-aminomutase
MTAGKAQLTQLLAEDFYRNMTKKTARFVRLIRQHMVDKAYPARVFQIGSIFWISFSAERRVQAASQIDAEGMDKFKILFHHLIHNGIYFGPSGYEVGFVSAAHTEGQLEEAAKVINEGLDLVYQNKQGNTNS